MSEYPRENIGLHPLNSWWSDCPYNRCPDSLQSLARINCLRHNIPNHNNSGYCSYSCVICPVSTTSNNATTDSSKQQLLRSPRDVDVHISSKGHQDRLGNDVPRSLYLWSLPRPHPILLERIDELLYKTEGKSSFSNRLVLQVKESVGHLNQLIQEKVSRLASLRMFGSLLTGLAVEKVSNVNLDLVVQKMSSRGRRPRTSTTTSSDDVSVSVSSTDDSSSKKKKKKVIKTPRKNKTRRRSSVTGDDDGQDKDNYEDNEDNEDDFEEDEEENPAEMLEKIAKVLEENQKEEVHEGIAVEGVAVQVYDVRKDFSSAIPKVTFKVRGISDKKISAFEITLSGQRSFETSKLIEKYVQLDPRVKTLGVCLRNWAALMGIDNQEAGKWPPHAFTLLLIYFLQNVRPFPVLPILQEAAPIIPPSPTDPQLGQPITESDLLKAVDEEDEEDDLRDEDIQDDPPTASADDNDVQGKGQPKAKRAIDEPQPTTIIMDPREGEGPDEVIPDSTLDRILNSAEAESWSSQNTSSVGELWVNFFRFYAVEFPAGRIVVSIRKPPVDPDSGQAILLTHSVKCWGTKIIAIEEPFRPYLNLSRSVGSKDIFHKYFLHHVRYTFEYFMVPVIKMGPKKSGPRSGENAIFTFFDHFTFGKWPITDGHEDEEGDMFVGHPMMSLFSHPDSKKWLDVRIGGIDLPKTDIEALNEVLVGSGQSSGQTSEAASLSSTATSTSFSAEDPAESDSAADFRLAKLVAQKFHLAILPKSIEALLNAVSLLSDEVGLGSRVKYDFQFRNRAWFRDPGKFCTLCRKYDHFAKSCPTERLPALVPIDPSAFPEDNKSRLSELLTRIVYQEHKISDVTKAYHERIRSDLQSFIRSNFPGVTQMSKAVISLFGSSVNGFGADSCDLDLCMTFEGNPTGKGVNSAKIIKSLARKFKMANKSVPATSVLPIIHAKVPILKFTYRLDGKDFECDISLYNVLALHNTRLLQTYCAIDERVSILGHVVKYFAKTCDICDASRGSLSSYAYTLMTLHYLQKEGVIPILQEVTPPGADEPGGPVWVDHNDEGWNVWFYDDVQRLKEVWTPTAEAARKSVSELFFGFLRYYAEEFRFDEDVICCRLAEPLTRVKKMWTGKKIAIEDPFLHRHNLGQGVANQMATFIKASIILGRNHFGQRLMSVDPTRNGHDEISIIFDRRKLTTGAVPQGRGCRFCHKVGHKAKDCQERIRHELLNGTNNRTRKEVRCYYCNELNHVITNCPNRGGPNDGHRGGRGGRPNHRGGQYIGPNQRIPQMAIRPPIPRGTLENFPNLTISGGYGGQVPMRFHRPVQQGPRFAQPSNTINMLEAFARQTGIPLHHQGQQPRPPTGGAPPPGFPGLRPSTVFYNSNVNPQNGQPWKD